ncbi:DUF21 domain-containing protein [Tanacetum coccineum]|uniref:DUF21 domain-containing protein n=1 Tax=Tanacetum coccineum TaxID=301880 RepID=A0ABQ4WAK8_9ASTR
MASRYLMKRVNNDNSTNVYEPFENCDYLEGRHCNKNYLCVTNLKQPFIQYKCFSLVNNLPFSIYHRHIQEFHARYYFDIPSLTLYFRMYGHDYAWNLRKLRMVLSSKGTLFFTKSTATKACIKLKNYHPNSFACDPQLIVSDQIERLGIDDDEVVFAGLMAGLTLGLMSLGLVDLEVLMQSGRPKDRLHASKIFPVVKNQHLLLCTLLIGNALAMESLPIFLDKLVPPWAAVLISVTLILMFGEILPQAICTRYGLTVGATMAPFVRCLLFLFFPISYPISKVLDWMLGKGHAALLRRAELKTFVNFHGNEAGKGGDLTHDETTIIAGALEMTEKTAKDAMTPISKAFSLDLDGTLTLDTLNAIMTMGHSRVPVYSGDRTNIIGIILVKNLLAVDPDDAVPLRKMLLRKVPRVADNMPLYDILNEFQKGHTPKYNSHDADNDSVKNDGVQQAKRSPPSTLAFKKRHRGCSFCILD